MTNEDRVFSVWMAGAALCIAAIVVAGAIDIGCRAQPIGPYRGFNGFLAAVTLGWTGIGLLGVVVVLLRDAWKS